MSKKFFERQLYDGNDDIQLMYIVSERVGNNVTMQLYTLDTIDIDTFVPPGKFEAYTTDGIPKFTKE